MANEKELLQTVTATIREVLNNPGLEVKLESKLMDDLHVESIDFLDISCELEKSIGRELDAKEFTAFVQKRSGKGGGATVKDLVDFIQAGG